MRNISAATKGFITGALMVAVSLILFYTKQSFDSPLQYSIYAIYLGGIIWTLYSFSESLNAPAKFSKFFLEGFKCFIVVTLLMVIFTFIFNKMHPEFKEQLAVAYKADLIKQGNSMPSDIEANVIKMKDYYLTILISRTIFAYLFLGAVITAAASFVFKKRK